MAKAKNKDIEQRFSDAQDRLVIQASDLSLQTVADMVDSGAIDLAPQYQRRERWDAKRQSALIESFLLNVPVPPVYLAEDDYGTYSVIDGKQRITAIQQFMNDELLLGRLATFRELEGLRFSDLPRRLSNALQVRPYLRVTTLLKQTDPKLKYEVFLRLNVGGQPLNAQEIRNVAFRGVLNDLVYDLAGTRFLVQQLKIKDEKSRAYREMLDAELVLRFFVLYEQWEDFSGGLRRSMDSFMRKRMKIRDDEVAQLRSRFLRAIDGCKKIWGAAAYRRPYGTSWRNQFLAGMYDAQMVAVAEADDAAIERAVQNRNKVLAETRDLFESRVFEESVRTGTNTPKRIKYRVAQVLDILETI